MMLCETGVFMRKLKLIKKLVTSIIMLATTQGVASTAMPEQNPAPQIQSNSELKHTRYELEAKLRARQSRELELFSKSLR